MSYQWQDGSPLEPDKLESGNLETNKPSSKIAPFHSLLVICGVVILVFVAVSVGHIEIGKFSSLSLSQDKSIAVTISNEYGSYDRTINSYPFLQSSLLIEPHRQSILAVEIPDTSCTFDLTVSDSVGVVVTSERFTESSWYVTVAGTGYFTASIEATCDSSTYSSSQQVWSKFVRRELSTLSLDDREEFLDALYTVSTVSTAEGKERFGESFVSMAHLAAIHVDASSNPVCDEFHPFSGFVNAHLYLGSLLEQSLQAVNPRVALHFMEYASLYSSDEYTAHLSDQLDGGKWNKYLTADYFGSSDVYDGRILDGRWANMTIPIVNDEFFAVEQIEKYESFFPDEQEELLAYLKTDSRYVETTADDHVIAHISSPFGLLRPPWNYNPSLYMTRYVNEVGMEDISGIGDASSSASTDILSYFTGTTCNDYLSFYEQVSTSSTSNLAFDEVVRLIGKYLHGHLHENIGGQSGSHARTVDAELRAKYGFTDSDILVIAERSHFFAREYIPQSTYYSSDEYPVYPLKCTESSVIASLIDKNSNSFSIIDEEAFESEVSCSCVDSYFTSKEDLQQLLTMYFGEKYMNLNNGFDQSSTPYKILNDFSLEDSTAIMQLLCGRMAFDGDFVGSSSAMDPIFWVAHPAIERYLHLVQFASDGLAVNYSFVATDEDCSGHSADGTLSWLKGFQFDMLPDVDATSVSNRELTAVLNPMDDRYAQYLSYVYDSSSGIGCSEVDSILLSRN